MQSVGKGPCLLAADPNYARSFKLQAPSFNLQASRPASKRVRAYVHPTW